MPGFESGYHPVEASFVSSARHAEEDRSRTREKDFYSEQSAAPAELTILQHEVRGFLDQFKGISLAMMGETGLRLIHKLHQLTQASELLTSVESELASSTRLRKEFGLPIEEIYYLSLPVFLELLRNELTATETVQVVASETRNLMAEIGLLWNALSLEMKRAAEEAEAKEKQWQNTESALGKLQTEGHGEVQEEKQRGGQHITVFAGRAAKDKTLLQETARSLALQQQAIQPFAYVVQAEANRPVEATQLGQAA
jgi:hypothetical protein